MNINHTLPKFIARLGGITVLLLMIPLIAMQFFDGVDWSLFDFIIAGALIFGTGLTYKLITWKSSGMAYRIAIAFALLTGLFLIWSNLAVGLIGSEDNVANLMYFGVIAVGIIGAFWADFQPDGMMYNMLAMACSHVVITVIALLMGLQHLPYSSVTEVVGVNFFFFMLFTLSALLFRYAAKENKIGEHTGRVEA